MPKKLKMLNYVKDLYLLSMAESVPVDYIVSGDKDLIEHGRHKGIPILTYNPLLALLQPAI